MTIGSVAGERAAVMGVVAGIVWDMPLWGSGMIFVRTTERLGRGDGRERGVDSCRSLGTQSRRVRRSIT